jgi:hypothetical protein
MTADITECGTVFQFLRLNRECEAVDLWY